MRSLPARRILALAPLLLAACSDLPVAAPSAGPAAPSLASFDCVADVGAGSIQCRPAAARTPDGARGALLLGGQGTYVRLASSGVSYDGASVFRADVTVRNLLGQSIGTTDGVNADPDGIRVFFHTGPTVTGGSGTVEVANEDGEGAFTGGAQPYFRYPEVLGAHQASAPHEWRFTVPNTVATFAFTVLVAAPVPDEGALDAIDLDPRTLAVAATTRAPSPPPATPTAGATTTTGRWGAPPPTASPGWWWAATAGRRSPPGATTPAG